MNESINISDYKKWSKYINKKYYDSEEGFFKLFKDHDKYHNRIYFPLKVEHKNWEIKIPTELRDYLNWFGYEIINYNEGIISRGGVRMRIGKLLNKIGRQDLLKTYSDSKQNILRNVTNLYVVISRHPYDLIGISTDRGWSTCLDLKDDRFGGKHLLNLRYYLQGGYIVAYLIRKNDRNINNPISRILLRRTYSGNLTEDNKIYGTHVDEFMKFIRKWISYHDQYNLYYIKNEKDFIIDMEKQLN